MRAPRGGGSLEAPALSPPADPSNPRLFPPRTALRHTTSVLLRLTPPDPDTHLTYGRSEATPPLGLPLVDEGDSVLRLVAVAAAVSPLTPACMHAPVCASSLAPVCARQT